MSPYQCLCLASPRLAPASPVAMLLRCKLLLLLLAASLQVATPARSVLAESGKELRGRTRCTFQIATPPVETPVARPGTRFVAAQVTALQCEPMLPVRHGLPIHLQPDALDGFLLKLHINLPEACSTNVGEGSPLRTLLAPRGMWLHLAGDSLLRGVFGTLTNVLLGRRWEEWRGEENFQRLFHLSRSLCCVNFSSVDANSCKFALHESERELLSSTRRELSSGRSCITYSFQMEYSEITASLLQLSATPGAAVPTRMVTSAALHTMKHANGNASGYRGEVDGFLTAFSAPVWADTALVIHACSAPNDTSVSAGHYPQTETVVRAFNEQLERALGAQAWNSAWAEQKRPLPRLVDYYSITEQTPARFPYLDSLHFSDPFYQTAFVVDALVLNAAACDRRAQLAAS